MKECQVRGKLGEIDISIRATGGSSFLLNDLMFIASIELTFPSKEDCAQAINKLQQEDKDGINYRISTDDPSVIKCEVWIKSQVIHNKEELFRKYLERIAQALGVEVGNIDFESSELPPSPYSRLHERIRNTPAQEVKSIDWNEL